MWNHQFHHKINLLQPIFCKDSANENNKASLLDFCRVQPIFCKDNTK